MEVMTLAFVPPKYSVCVEMYIIMPETIKWII